jgi:hypothetical protein
MTEMQTGRPWVLYWITLANIALGVCHYLGLLAYASWARGLAWWFQPFVALGPPLALASLLLSLRRPRRWSLLGLNTLIFTLYVAIWAPLIPQLGWRGGS